jgi:hypothetical protein
MERCQMYAYAAAAAGMRTRTQGPASRCVCVRWRAAPSGLLRSSSSPARVPSVPRVPCFALSAFCHFEFLFAG